MVMKTRSTGNGTDETDAPPQMAADSQASKPPKLFILPERSSADGKILSLPNPRTSAPSQYYFCAEKGIHEFTKVAAPRSAYKSWLVGSGQKLASMSVEGGLPVTIGSDINDECGQSTSSATGTGNGPNKSGSMSEGYVLKSAELFIATPFDPLFLLLPGLCPPSSSAKSKPTRQLFLPADDIFDELGRGSSGFGLVVNDALMRQKMEARLQVVCDCVEAADEKMYRLNNGKLLKELMAKARKMVDLGLPASIEERFVRKALEMPMIGIKHEDSSMPEGGKSFEERSGSNDEPVPSETTSSVSTTVSSMCESSLSTVATTSDEQPISAAPGNIINLLRLRTALMFISSAYVPAHLSSTLDTMLPEPGCSVDFKPLDQYLAHIARIRAQILSSRSLSDFSRKRSMNEDDEAAETRGEKKLKRDEDERRKNAGESRGVRDLKKVDTSGMKKLSDFFKGSAVKKKS
ncbi:Ribonuclease H2, subunit B [Lasallia pustulata]|uniref:Ribonuclease H2 subunit B n=1 Tax=Lasallia pustulata TaxID=136370 RepID=A0A1W5D2E2_9LECA|nr:Ribonuclease H2, subunit B [Lasallia pustulata]